MDEDVEVTKLKALKFWDQIDEVLEQMERIEGLYKIKEPPTDFFRDEDYVRNKLETKKQYNFYERA